MTEILKGGGDVQKSVVAATIAEKIDAAKPADKIALQITLDAEQARADADREFQTTLREGMAALVCPDAKSCARAKSNFCAPCARMPKQPDFYAPTI